jgi:hypothetical protein
LETINKTGKDMRFLKYTRGEFSEDDTLPECDDIEDWSDYPTTAGFDSFGTRLGDEDGGSFKIHASKKGRSYLVDFSLTGNEWEFIHIPDFISMMMFLRDFGPIIELSALREDINQMKTLTERTFRKYHEHEVSVVCKECDPLEFRDREKWVRERLAKRGGKPKDSKP